MSRALSRCEVSESFGANLCDEGVAIASEKKETEVIRATAACSGGLEICMQMRPLKDETPAYQLRQKIATKVRRRRRTCRAH